ncbi:hypothetical protein CFIO01_10167 [Colletotrichum fioriniae PJ7]|uniref:Uncharacterized protein n=1 Tax=Colletotrichum fioriniae PJ7 TaxID=1445577 RepID=A0A010QTJ5_9PEZI|nr:hypothetical protein CFIO01_10167 [Colletotrichum fioriniae PJ7]
MPIDKSDPLGLDKIGQLEAVAIVANVGMLEVDGAEVDGAEVDGAESGWATARTPWTAEPAPMPRSGRSTPV